MADENILPPHSGPAETALAEAIRPSFDISVAIRDVWKSDRAPLDFLPWLAWTFSLDDWSPDWTEDEKRQAIASSVAIHRIKGTRRSIEMALSVMGYPGAVITENRDLPRYGTQWSYGGEWVYGPDDAHWADYWIEVRAPITRAEADALAQRIATVAPARSRLREVRLAGVYYAYGDGLWTYGSPVSYGGIYQFGV